MLEPDETAKSNDSAELGRPVKRLAVENSTSKLPNTSKSKQICLLSISNNSVRYVKLCLVSRHISVVRCDVHILTLVRYCSP